jgi:hypothetical protein
MNIGNKVKRRSQSRYDISHRLALDPSQLQLQIVKTSTGNIAQDLLLRENFGLKQIGRSILDLPTTLEELEALH